MFRVQKLNFVKIIRSKNHIPGKQSPQYIHQNILQHRPLSRESLSVTAILDLLKAIISRKRCTFYDLSSYPSSPL